MIFLIFRKLLQSQYNHRLILKTIVPVAAILFIVSCYSFDSLDTMDLKRDVSISSINVHYLVPNNDETDWENRRYALTAALLEIDSDLILFQEMETFEGRIPKKIFNWIGFWKQSPDIPLLPLESPGNFP